MNAITTLMERAIADGVFPAAELLVAARSTILLHEHLGDLSGETIFDIASLTKPIATATRCMQMVATGQLSLETPLVKLLPQAEDTPAAGLTCRQLLNHTAGCVAWRPWYQQVAQKMIGAPRVYEQIVLSALNEPLETMPGTQGRYSDVGYILLGAGLEQLDGRGLEEQFAEEIADPLGLTDTFFRPLPQAARGVDRYGDRDYAPTEACAWRGETLRGFVHDQNCYAMGGVAGHAGLFSTALDLHTFIHQCVSCYRGHSEWIDQAIVRTFLDRRHIDVIANASHLCGWDTPGSRNSQAGKHFGHCTIGHLGYTGCSMWIDLEQDWWVILLTNRIHPRTDNEQIRLFRPTLHDTIYQQLIAP